LEKGEYSLTPQTSLKNALYQEFFTSKGSLAIEEPILENLKGESWELYEKRGRLYLKGDSEAALAQALALLSRFSPEQAYGLKGKWHPKWPIRALYTRDKRVAEKALKWGFNAILGSEAPPPLRALSFDRSHAQQNISRDKTLQDLMVDELQASSAQVFYTDEPTSFHELDLVPGERILSFSDESVWKVLNESPPFGTPLLPMIKLSDVQERLPLILNRMARHPFQGLIVDVESFPEPGSDDDKTLAAAGFALYLGLPVEMFI
jgi:hypothetical protein